MPSATHQLIASLFPLQRKASLCIFLPRKALRPFIHTSARRQQAFRSLFFGTLRHSIFLYKRGTCWKKSVFFFISQLHYNIYSQRNQGFFQFFYKIKPLKKKSTQTYLRYIFVQAVRTRRVLCQPHGRPTAQSKREKAACIRKIYLKNPIYSFDITVYLSYTIRRTV